jgi:phosphoglycolate phosphatase-like HAD superfamily hydrolase
VVGWYMRDYTSIALDEGEGLYVDSELPALKNSDAIVFDLDGTLIDSRMSLDESLLSTVQLLFGAISGKLMGRRELLDAAFELRKTGGFNNPCDVSYSLLVALCTSVDESCLLKVTAAIESGLSRVSELLSVRSTPCALEDVDSCLREVVQYGDARGTTSILEGIDRLYGGKRKKELMRRFESALKYPGMPPDSIVSSVFDSLFLGRRRYKEVHGLEPAIDLGPGLFTNEKAIIQPETASYVKRRFPGGSGLATGRPRYMTENSMPTHISQMLTPGAITYFDHTLEEASKRNRVGEFTCPSKPDPFSLNLTASHLNPSRGLIYVGDSTEDLLMARAMSGYGETVHFVGVYGCSVNPRIMKGIFMQMGASAVLPSVNKLGWIL